VLPSSQLETRGLEAVQSAKSFPQASSESAVSRSFLARDAALALEFGPAENLRPWEWSADHAHQADGESSSAELADELWMLLATPRGR
jgi:hypothetical protein